MKAIVLAGSKGIGKGITDQLKLICDELYLRHHQI